MLRSIIATMVVASALLAQVSKPAPKAGEQKALPVGYVLDALLVKDEGCLKDVVRNLHASGVEQRKQTAELLKYGCIEQMQGLMYHADVQEIRTIALGPSKQVKVYKVLMILDVEMQKVLTGKYPDNLDAIEHIKEGWVFEDKFLPRTKEQMVSEIEELRHGKPE